MFADAAAYERFMGRWSRRLAPRLLDLAAPADPRRVLDVGSGTGNLALAVAERWPTCAVVGVDPSRAFVAYARSRVGERQPVSFVEGDATRLPHGAGEFDASLALLVLNFVPDPQAALAEMVRVTRPGGVVAAAVWDYGEGMGMLRAFWDAVVSVDPATAGLDEAHMRLAGAGELAGLFARSGLAGVEERVLEVETPFATFEDFWEPLTLGVGPAGAYVASAAPDLRERVREELRRRLGAGPFAFGARARAVRGRRPPGPPDHRPTGP